MDKTKPSDGFVVGSTPAGCTKKYCRKGYVFCSIFLSKSQTWYIIAARRISSRLRRVYHHRRCIPLRLDDIQNFVLMICNFCEIDDIHGFAVIYTRVRIHTQNCRKYLFYSPYTNKKDLLRQAFFVWWNEVFPYGDIEQPMAMKTLTLMMCAYGAIRNEFYFT